MASKEIRLMCPESLFNWVEKQSAESGIHLAAYVKELIKDDMKEQQLLERYIDDEMKKKLRARYPELEKNLDHLMGKLSDNLKKALK